MFVLESDENEMYYLNTYNMMSCIYFLEIKNIYLNVEKNMEVIQNVDNVLNLLLYHSLNDQIEHASIVKRNLIKKQ